MENELIKILYVDDEKPNLFNFKQLFQDDFEIYTALSAAEGSEILKERDIQIVVSDQRMPAKSGIEFLAEVSQFYPDTIRILLTAYTDAPDIIDAINIGQVYQYITKPFQAENVANILNKASEIWKLKKHNQELLIQLKEKNEEYEQANEELRQSNIELYESKKIVEESELKYKAVVDNVGEGIAFVDPSEEIKFANPFAEIIFGVGKNELVGKNLKEFLSIDNFDIIQENTNIRKQGQVNTYEFDLIRLDGSLRNILITAVPQFSDFDNFTGTYGIFRDITERRKIEESLKESEERYRLLIDNAAFPAFITSFEGELLFMNHFVETFFGYEFKEIQGKKVPDFRVNPQDRESFIKELTQKGNVQNSETDIYAKNGEVKTVLISSNVIEFKGQKAIFSIFNDITERKNVENLLFERNLFIESIIDLSPDILYIYDIIDQKNIFSNEGIQKILDFSVDEVQAMGNQLIPNLMHPDDLKIYNEKILPQYAITIGNSQIINQYRMKSKSGNWHWIESTEIIYKRNNHGEPQQIFGVGKDITERKKAEIAFKKEYQRAESYLNLVEVILVAIDTQARVTLLNRKGHEVLGYNQGELIGKEWFKFCLTPETFSIVNKSYSKIISGEIQPSEYYENQVLTKTGEKRWIAWHNSVIRDENGAVLGLLSSGEDITDRKKAEERIYESEERYRTLYESMIDAYASVDMKGNLTQFNQAYSNMLGYSNEELFKLTYFDFTPKSWYQFEQDIIDSQVLTNGYSELYQKEYYKKDGTVFPVELRTYLIKDKQGEPVGMWAIVRDITERKKADEAIKDSEIKYRYLFEQNPSNLLIYEIETLKILSVNEAFTNHYGYTKDEAVSMQLYELFPIRERSTLTDLTKKIAGNVFAGEWSHTKKDGTLITVSAYSHELKFENRFARIVVINDITERIKAEAQLRKSEEKYRFLTENILDVIWIIDITQMKFTYISPSIEKMRGYTAEEVMEQPINKSLTPDSASNFEKIMAARIKDFNEIQERKIYIDEFEQFCKDGSTVWIETITYLRFNFENKPEIIGTSRNIAERKKLQLELENYQNGLEKLVEQRTEELFAAKEHFELVFNINPDIAAITRLTDYAVTNVNEAYQRIIGMEKEGLIGKESSNVWVDQDKRLQLNDLLKKQDYFNNLEAEFRSKDGSFFTGMISGKIFTSQNIPYLITLTRDISERKQMEKELHLSKENAEEANRVKSEFLSNMSHELRTPLNAILGFSKLLRYQKNITEPQKEQLTTIHECGEHLLSLINDILDMSKIEAHKLDLNLSEVDLPNILHTIFNINKIKADEKDLEYVLEIKSSLPHYVLGDERKLKQIMLNLINNAIKFTDEGSIKINADFIEEQSIFIFEVIDTGIGIVIEKQDEIFKPFIQQKGTKIFAEGTGLGLSISKSIIEMMNGKIILSSEPDKGSDFRVEIPLKKLGDYTSAEKPKELQFTGYIGDSRKILVIDDNYANVSFLISLLDSIGFIVETAENGKIALEKLEAFEPHLILLDYRMPVMDGLEFLKLFENNISRKKMVIIGVSATLHQKDLKRQFCELCDDFVEKPVDTNLLFNKMRNLLGIEWIKEDSSVAKQSLEFEKLVYPETVVLDSIYEMAEIGDYNSIHSLMINLIDSNNAFETFCRQMIKSAKNYDKKSIFQLLKQVKE